MSDLDAFLHARLDEDEANEHLDRISAEDRAALLADFDAGESPEYPHMEVGFGRWLAEVQAKRTILGLMGDPDAMILRVLALPYADHPDYRPEWRP